MWARSGVNSGSAPGRLHAATTTASASVQTAVFRLTTMLPPAPESRLLRRFSDSPPRNAWLQSRPVRVDERACLACHLGEHFPFVAPLALSDAVAMVGRFEPAQLRR